MGVQVRGAAAGVAGMSHDKRRQFGNECAGVLGKDKAVEEWDKFLKDGPDMPNITTAEPLTATTRLAASPENPVTDLTWPPPALTIALAKAGGPGLPPALALRTPKCNTAMPSPSTCHPGRHLSEGSGTAP